MPNTNAPFGFEHITSSGGRGTSFANTQRLIAAGNTDVIYTGDPVYSLASGYIAKATPGVTPIHGIFVGCEYYSPGQNQKVYRPAYLGAASGASGDITAQVISDETAEYLVRVGGSTSVGVVQADVGNNIQFAYGTGNASTGISGAFVDVATVATTPTLPFRIVGLTNGVPGSDGADVAAYNIVRVRVNNQDFNQLTGV